MNWIDEAAASLKASPNYRTLRKTGGQAGPRIVIEGREVLNLCSNNYLGLAGDERLKMASIGAAERFGSGSGGSRLISGNLEIHGELERMAASFKGTESAILFNSGYCANVGILQALAGAGDEIFSDELNHASIIDGCRLSKAAVSPYPHANTSELDRMLGLSRARRKIIVTDTIFSMDGDFAPIVEIADLRKKHGAALVVDEAHACGVIGKTGSGIIEEAGLGGEVDIQMGTFSKALGSFGAFAAGSRGAVKLILNKARSFIFTTALPPSVCGASIAGIKAAIEGTELRRRLMRNAGMIRKGLGRAGFNTFNSAAHIIPVMVGDSATAMKMCEALLEEGVFVQGIRPPTVKEGTARLRVAPMATHTEEEISRAIVAFEKTGRKLGIV